MKFNLVKRSGALLKEKLCESYNHIVQEDQEYNTFDLLDILDTVETLTLEDLSSWIFISSDWSTNPEFKEHVLQVVSKFAQMYGWHNGELRVYTTFGLESYKLFMANFSNANSNQLLLLKSKLIEMIKDAN